MKEKKEIEVTNEQVLIFNKNAQSYLDVHPGRISAFLYAIGKMLKTIKKLADDYEEKYREINIKYAKKEDGFCVMDKRPVEVTDINGKSTKTEDDRFKFEAEKLGLLNTELRELLNKKVKITPHITDDLEVPQDMDMRWWNVLSPFVLPDDPSEEMLQQLFAKEQNQKLIINRKLPVNGNN